MVQSFILKLFDATLHNHVRHVAMYTGIQKRLQVLQHVMPVSSIAGCELTDAILVFTTF